MSNLKDILWINYVKAISIIGVFFVHTTSYYGYEVSNLNTFIHPFYVNAFFFISGYLLFRKQLSDRLLKEDIREYLSRGGKELIFSILWRIAIPTLLFSLIEFYPSHIIRGHVFDWGTFMYKTIGGGTYWFTASLVVAEVILLLLLFSRVRNIWFYFFSCCSIFAVGGWLVLNDFNIMSSYPSFPWAYKNGMFAVLFLAFGGLYWRYETHINKLMNNTVLLFMIVLYVTLLSIWPNEFHVLVSMLDVNIPGMVLSLLSTIILIEICKLIPTFRLLNYIGKNTIGFYFMSGALPIVLSLIVHRSLPTSVFGLCLVFIASVL